MSDPRDVKARVMARLEAIVEQLAADQPPSEQITLTDMEGLVKQAGREIEAQVMQALVEAHEAPASPAGQGCPVCQQAMRNKGRQRRKVVTEVGEIEVYRTYYYCEQCQAGVFPPG